LAPLRWSRHSIRASRCDSTGQIPDDHVGPITKPFARSSARPEEDRGRPGLGLCLYIVAEIARAHGGTTAAERIGDERSRFSILPRYHRPLDDPSALAQYLIFGDALVVAAPAADGADS
jgi:signal transduction histidine kinase